MAPEASGDVSLNEPPAVPKLSTPPPAAAPGPNWTLHLLDGHTTHVVCAWLADKAPKIGEAVAAAPQAFSSAPDSRLLACSQATWTSVAQLLHHGLAPNAGSPELEVLWGPWGLEKICRESYALHDQPQTMWLDENSFAFNATLKHLGQ